MKIHQEFLLQCRAFPYNRIIGSVPEIPSASPRADLIKWKTGIDSITDSENFKMLVRSFSEETGLNPSDARPCEIIAWKKIVINRSRNTI